VFVADKHKNPRGLDNKVKVSSVLKREKYLSSAQSSLPYAAISLTTSILSLDEVYPEREEKGPPGQRESRRSGLTLSWWRATI
jgi:hypothetical protein